MGDHFVLLMDRLITASTLEAAIESRNLSQFPVEVEKSMVDSTPQWLGDSGTGSPATKVVECRICQEEDYDSNMESPCACCGSLKYAHRKCIQRWCNEKGDTVCEICHQPFKPNYTAPPQMFHYGGIPMNFRYVNSAAWFKLLSPRHADIKCAPSYTNDSIALRMLSEGGVFFRGSWEISRQDIHNPQFIAMVATDRSFLDSAYDEYSAYNSRSAFCCRTVAVIFMALLILRHGLPILFGGADEYAFTMFVLFLLRTAGILVPVYIMVRALAAFQRRRQSQEVQDIPLTSSEDEI